MLTLQPHFLYFCNNQTGDLLWNLVQHILCRDLMTAAILAIPHLQWTWGSSSHQHLLMGKRIWIERGGRIPWSDRLPCQRSDSERVIRKAVSAGCIYTSSSMTHSTLPLIELTTSTFSSLENRSSCRENPQMKTFLHWIVGVAIFGHFFCSALLGNCWYVNIY